MIWIIIASDTVASSNAATRHLDASAIPPQSFWSHGTDSHSGGEVDETLDPFCRCPRDPHLTGTARASLPRPRKRVAVSPCPGAGIAQN